MREQFKTAPLLSKGIKVVVCVCFGRRCCCCFYSCCFYCGCCFCCFGVVIVIVVVVVVVVFVVVLLLDLTWDIFTVVFDMHFMHFTTRLPWDDQGVAKGGCHGECLNSKVPSNSVARGHL